MDDQAGAGADGTAGLGALALDLDLAAIDGLGGQLAGLEEARGPEPLVQALSLGGGAPRCPDPLASGRSGS